MGQSAGALAEAQDRGFAHFSLVVLRSQTR